MDFLDYEVFDTSSHKSNELDRSELPEPATPLVLSLNPDITNKFKSLSLLKQKFDFKSKDTQEREQDESVFDNSANITTKIAEKYAKLTVELLNTSYNNNSEVLISDLPANKSSKSDAILTNKLSKILNSYESNDPTLREALNILQAKKELDLKSLIRSDLYGSISRRRFRSDIEGDLLKQHTNLLREFQPIVENIERLGDKIHQLNDINDKLNELGGLDPQVVSKIEDLTREKNIVLLKKSILQNFKKAFTLSQYEEHYLSNEDISFEYFEILSKCIKIHSNCSILLSLQNPQIGFKIIEKMNNFQDLSYQRISFFLSNQLDSFIDNKDNDGFLTAGSNELKLMKISFFYLSRNLKYFDEITTKLVQSRSKFIVDDLLFQLNNSETSDHSRPIVLSAYDPLRYTGDILAYVHTVIVNEVEFITNMFQFDNEPETERTELEEKLFQAENLKDLKTSMASIVSKIVGSLSRPLKIRIEQTLRNENNIEVVHKIFNLIGLYGMMYEKQLPKGSRCSIFETLDLLKKLSVERVFNLIREQITLVEKDNGVDDWTLGEDDSLLPPEWLRNIVSENLVIFNDHNNSLDNGNIFELKDEDFKVLASLIVDKPIELIKKQSETNFKSDPRSQKIFELNAFDMIHSRILPIPLLTSKVQELTDIIFKTKEELIKHQFESLLKNSGLEIHQQLIQLVFPIEQIETADDYYMYSSLIENKLFGKNKLSEIEAQLHEFLPVALMETQQALFKISSPSIANDIITESSLRFLKLYNVFYKILEILYEDEKILEWSTLDVATLLGVEEIYKSN